MAGSHWYYSPTSRAPGHGAEPHAHISQTAADLLRAWQKPLLGDQVSPFVHRYCIYPDMAFKPKAKPYIMPPPAGVKSLLHLPAGMEQNKLVFGYYLPRAIALFREGNTTEAMKYFGCAAYYIKDSSCCLSRWLAQPT